MSRTRLNSHTTSQDEKVKYRESNSSRLRRERKCHPVTSDGVNSSCRSKSCSSPRRSPIPNVSNSMNGSGARSPERSRSNNSSRSVSASLKATEKRIIEPKSRDVNPRSKNISSPSNYSAKMAETIKPVRNSQRCTPSDPEPLSGYGKPLVTPMQRKLLVNRNTRPVSSPAPVSKIPLPQLGRSRSPNLPWKENRPSSTRSTPQRDLSRASILSSKPCSDKQPGNAREARNPPVMAFNTAVRVRPRPPTPELKSSVARSAAGNKTPQDTNSTPKPKIIRASKNKQKIQDDVRSNASSHRSLNNQNSEIFAHIKMPSSIKTNSEVTNHKNEIFAHVNPPSFAKPSFVNYGSKNYKPQLEDIKSSDFVLNVKKQDHSVKRNKSPIPIQKPQPLIEEQRKMALLQAKNKFKTKKFWDDARYEKIEGLNWVSWK